MSEPYSELDTALLKARLAKQRANLAFLEGQAAGFGPLYLPLPLNNQLEDTKTAIAAIERQLARRGHHGDPPSTPEQQEVGPHAETAGPITPRGVIQRRSRSVIVVLWLIVLGVFGWNVGKLVCQRSALFQMNLIVWTLVLAVALALLSGRIVWERSLKHKHPLTGLVVALILCVTLGGIARDYRRTRPVLPATSLIVAIADFTPTTEGVQWADRLAQDLETQRLVRPWILPTSITFVRIGFIEEESAVNTVASHYGATIIVWGKSDPGSPRKVVPSFKIIDPIEGYEVAGLLNLSTGDAQHDDQDPQQIQTRIKILTVFVQGLTSFFSGKYADMASGATSCAWKNADPALYRDATDAFSKTITLVEHAHDQDPQLTTILDTLYFYHGRSLFEAGDYPQAQAAFTQSLKINPSNAWARLGQGTIAFMQFQESTPLDTSLFERTQQAYSDTLRLYETGTTLPPVYSYADAKAYYNLGVLYLTRGQRDPDADADHATQARTYFEKAQERYTAAPPVPSNTALYADYAASIQYAIGITYEMDHDLKRASAAYQVCALMPRQQSQGRFAHCCTARLAVLKPGPPLTPTP